MTTAIQLKKKLNLSADIFESTEDIGGTWHYNQYPQAASDVPSHLYSFSFELNPSRFSIDPVDALDTHLSRQIGARSTAVKKKSLNICAVWPESITFMNKHSLILK